MPVNKETKPNYSLFFIMNKDKLRTSMAPSTESCSKNFCAHLLKIRQAFNFKWTEQLLIQSGNPWSFWTKFLVAE